MKSAKTTNIQKKIVKKSESMTDVAGRELRVLKDVESMKIAHENHCSMRFIYEEALKQGIYPYRYIRNREVISPEEQLKLAMSNVAVIGAGGLGGNVILLLARLGIGHIVIVDHDSFEESNLNRQALCTEESIGVSKSQTASTVINSINPGVETTAVTARIDVSNIEGFIKNSDVVVDALDNISDRFIIERAAKNNRIPMVHGALAGFDGQIMTIFPDDRGLRLLYGNYRDRGEDKKRPEALLGVPSLTASVIGTFQAMEVLKILLGRGRKFRNMMIHIDFAAGTVNEYSFKEPQTENGNQEND